MTKQLSATHGIVCRIPDVRFGYFGWPTVARTSDGTLWVASSGRRVRHVCPFGKTVLNTSTDNGHTWSPPRVIQDSMIDDRDAGIVDLGDGKLLVTWFRSDTRAYASESWQADAESATWPALLATWSDEEVDRLLGSWVLLSEDGGATWGSPARAPVSAPHGPIQLADGSLLYLGKRYGTWGDMRTSAIVAAVSRDDGRTWVALGEVQVCPGTDPVNYHEPHVVALPSGRLIGVIRIQDHSGKDLQAAGIPTFSIMQTESDDGGTTWTQARPLGFHGSPPHIFRHSSGALILTYGYRLEPFGQRVALSYDEGVTWDHDWILREDGPNSDLGYPSTVELDDGSLFTVYYQKVTVEERASLMWSRWQLPARGG